MLAAVLFLCVRHKPTPPWRRAARQKAVQTYNISGRQKNKRQGESRQYGAAVLPEQEHNGKSVGTVFLSVKRAELKSRAAKGRRTAHRWGGKKRISIYHHVVIDVDAGGSGGSNL